MGIQLYYDTRRGCVSCIGNIVTTASSAVSLLRRLVGTRMPPEKIF